MFVGNKVMFCWFLSGCQNTPARGSRYCSEHVDIATTFRDDECPTSTKSPDEIDTVIVKIVNEKNTRQGKYFEVLYLYMIKEVMFTMQIL